MLIYPYSASASEPTALTTPTSLDVDMDMDHVLHHRDCPPPVDNAALLPGYIMLPDQK